MRNEVLLPKRKICFLHACLANVVNESKYSPYYVVFFKQQRSLWDANVNARMCQKSVKSFTVAIPK